MGSRAADHDLRFDTEPTTSRQDREEAEGILRSLNRSFDQVNLAAEFLLLGEDPKHTGRELQLACLIRDRIARIEEQVTELYRVMNRPSRPPSREPAQRAPLLQ